MASGSRRGWKRVLAAAFAVSACAALLGGALTASAAVVRMGVPELTAASSRVVEGTVLSATPRAATAAEAPATIVTDYLVQVADRFKGTAGATLTYSQPGGTLGGRTQLVSDLPEIAVGDHVVLFLDARGRLVGGYQGKVGVDAAGKTSLGSKVADLKAAVGRGSDVRASAETKTVSKTIVRDIWAPLYSAGAADAAPVFAVQAAAALPFTDGFETGMGNWARGIYEGAAQATWDRTTYRAASGSYSAYCAQSAVAAPGSYSANMATYMIVGPLDLSSVPDAYFEFDVLSKVTDPNDGVSVMFSTNGTNFYGWGYSGGDGTWEHMAYFLNDLPPNSAGVRSVCGQQVWIYIGFESDGANQSEGLYVDDVNVSTGATVTPHESRGGVDMVTVTGSGFGATQGTGRVGFPGDDVWIDSGTYSSWTDSTIVYKVPHQAGSGWGIVLTPTGRAIYFAEHVTFSYLGYRWFAPSLTYYVNAAGSGLAPATTEGLVDAGASEWNDLSPFGFVDAGTTSAVGDVSAGTCNIWWQSGAPAGVLAQTFIEGAGGYLSDTDIRVNPAFAWGDGAPGTYDIQSVIAHELGHTLCLEDQYGVGDEHKTMYGVADIGSRKRVLSAEDIAGIRYIYGSLPLPHGSFTLNGGLAQTSNTAVLADATGIDDATQMAYNPAGSWLATETFATTKNLSLAGEDGTKTVLGRFANATGAYVTSATIVLDRTAPAGTMALAGGATTTSVTAVTIDSSMADTFTPAASLQMRWNLNGGAGWTSWTGYAASKPVTLPGASGAKTVNVEYRDIAGNVRALSDAIQFLPPPMGSFSLNGGSAQTSSTAVTANAAGVTDAAEMAYNPGGSWQPTQTFAPSFSLTLPAGDGTKTVLGRFSNGSGTLSASAEILLDQTGPAGTMWLAGQAPSTASLAVTIDSSMADTYTPAAAVQMRWDVHDGSGYTGWTAYQATRTVTLPGPDTGLKTVTVQYRDALWNVTTREDTIEYDPPAAPEGSFVLEGGSTLTASTAITADASGISGASEMAYRVAGGSWTATETFTATRELVLPSGDGTKVVEARFASAGGMHECSATIVLDQTPPVASVTLNGGAATSGLLSMTLGASASDTYTPAGNVLMRWDLHDGAGWSGWTAFLPSRTVVFSGAVGVKTVDVEFKDDVGNISAASDTISYAGAALYALEGRDRYQTAALMAQASYPQWGSVRHVVIAAGDNRAMADPLSAAGLCNLYDAPLLLVPGRLVNGRAGITEDMLRALPGPTYIHVVGGPAAVTPAVVSRLRGLTKGGGIEQVYGANRYGTAEAVYYRMRDTRKALPDNVLIANGWTTSGYYDALALSTITRAKGYPLLLVRATDAPGETRRALEGYPRSQIWAAGNYTNIPPGVLGSGYAGLLAGEGQRGPGTAGADRVGTAAAVAAWASDPARGWLGWADVAVGNGLPDALAGGAFIGKRGGVMLYTDAAPLHRTTKEALAARKSAVANVWVLGGPVVVSAATRAEISQALAP